MTGLLVSVPAFAEGLSQKGGRGIPADAPNGQFERGQGLARSSVAGAISSIDGTTLVVAGMGVPTKESVSDVSYTIDASNAIVRRANATSTLSTLVVGETVIVAGAVTDGHVVATVIDVGMKFREMNGSSIPVVREDVPVSASENSGRGFFASIGRFFSGLFGF